jgi:hypothetical protein
MRALLVCGAGLLLAALIALVWLAGHRPATPVASAGDITPTIVEAAPTRARSSSAPPRPMRGEAKVPPSREQAATLAVARLDQALADQAADGRWSASVERDVRDLLASEKGHGGRLTALACKSSLCRVEIAHDDRDSQEAFLERLTYSAPFDSEGLVRRTTGADGTQRTLVYFARQGQRLPRLDP